MDDPGAAVTLAVETLARELGRPTAEITVVEIRPVTWPNSALGCPQPDLMYMQVITPGYRVLLIHAGQQYFMHTDRGHRAVRCPHGGILGETKGGAPTNRS